MLGLLPPQCSTHLAFQSLPVYTLSLPHIPESRVTQVSALCLGLWPQHSAQHPVLVLKQESVDKGLQVLTETRALS